MNAATATLDRQSILDEICQTVAAGIETMFSLGLVEQNPRITAADLDRIEADWRDWFPAINPDGFRHEFGDFHADIWNWYWPLLTRRLNDETVTDIPLTLLAIMGRGLGKSATMENMVVCEGAQMQRAFIVYVSSTQDKADEHLATIRDVIESSQVARYYPGLSSPRIGKFG